MESERPLVMERSTNDLIYLYPDNLADLRREGTKGMGRACLTGSTTGGK